MEMPRSVKAVRQQVSVRGPGHSHAGDPALGGAWPGGSGVRDPPVQLPDPFGQDLCLKVLFRVPAVDLPAQAYKAA